MPRIKGYEDVPLSVQHKRACAEADKLREFWHLEKKRTDVLVWVDYDKDERRYLIRSNLVNGMPPALAQARR